MTRRAQPVLEHPLKEAAVETLYARSRASSWDISLTNFAAILHEVAGRYLPEAASEAEIQSLCGSLRLEELALARACADGMERAWESFLIRYREKLYEMAMSIAREQSAARDLADSIYAELYGISGKTGERSSKLRSYTGRGSLEGWLRTVLAQEFVNRYRKQQRNVSLEEQEEQGTQFIAAEPVIEATVDQRLEEATNEALAALPAEDRFVLASYHLDGRTLAEIALTLGVHESTISRRLEKLAAGLRKQILAGLARRGMSRRQAQESMEVDVRDLRLQIRGKLVQDSSSGAFSPQKLQSRAKDEAGRVR